MTQAQEFRGNTHRKLAELNTWAVQRTEAVLEPDLPIIDTHHHLWDDDHRGRYSIDELMEDIGTGHNIIATVYVEDRSKYRDDGPTAMQPVGEVEFVNNIVASKASGRVGKSRLCAGIVGHADLMLGDRVKPVLEALIAAGKGRLRSIRYGLAWLGTGKARYGPRQVPNHLALDPAFRRGYACLQPLGLSFDAWLFHPQLPDLVDLLAAFPDTNVILNHTGGPIGIPPYDNKRDEVFKIWRSHILDLARLPNLSVKIGGLGMPRCGWGFHLRDVPPSSEELAAAWRPYIEACIEAFGAGRCMLESNFPVDKQSCGYGVLWNAMKRITQGYSVTEKAALYRDAAARCYRLAA